MKALTKAYTARARIFHNGVVASGVDLLIAEIDGISESDLSWNLKSLGITASAFQRVKQSKGRPHQVFAHPNILTKRPHLVAYYRNIATISKKGISQILFPTEKYEARRSGKLERADANKLCRVLNRILSGVIDSIPNYQVHVSRKAILAEIGAQLQGTWANLVGQGASKNVERILKDYIDGNDLGAQKASGRYELNNGWTIVFGAEPDVAFFDQKQVKRIAIEIKGSLDVAGAQTRYGEAKKSFAKQILENPRCHTVYLASCFTGAVIDQIKVDGQVRDWFNLTSVLSDKDERQRFLKLLFHIVNTPPA
jgi:hypothetical protein